MKRISNRFLVCVSSFFVLTLFVYGVFWYCSSSADGLQGESVYSNVANDFASISRDTSIDVDDNGELSIARKSFSEDKVMGKEDTWTLLVYMTGSNLESQYECATSDLQEMLSANITEENIKNVNIIIQTGGSKDWHSNRIVDDKIGRYKVEANSRELTCISRTKNQNMGDANTLYEFLDWGVNNYPAEHMGVILWNHGAGVSKGLCFDENYDDESLSVHELEYAFAKVKKKMTSKFELLGFDTCLSGSLEYANLLAPYAKYMVASADVALAKGYFYTDVVNHLLSNPDATGAELGKTIVDSTTSFLDNYFVNIKQQAYYTQAVYDLSQVENACKEVNYFAKYIYDIILNNPDNYKELARFRSNTLAYTYDCVDIGSILYEIENNSIFDYDTTNFRKSISNLILHSKFKNKFDNKKCGLAISLYLPIDDLTLNDLNTMRNVCFSPYLFSFIEYMNARSKCTDISGYNFTSWVDSPYFFEDNFDFINYDYDYNEKDNPKADVINEAVKELLLQNTAYKENGFAINWFNNINLGTTNNSEINPLSIDNTIKLSTNKDLISTTVDESTKSNITDIYNTVFTTIDDTTVCLGQNNNLTYDKKTGQLTSPSNLEWFMLPDGQLLTTYIIKQNENTTIYSFPVLIDDIESSICVEETKDNNGNKTYTTLGVWDSISNKQKGKAGRGYLPLHSGSTITPIYDIFNPNSDTFDTIYGEEYTIQNQFDYYITTLNRNETSFAYQLQTITGNTIYSDILK